jgi:hypothetical protein
LRRRARFDELAQRRLQRRTAFSRFVPSMGQTSKGSKGRLDPFIKPSLKDRYLRKRDPKPCSRNDRFGSIPAV